MIPPVEIPVGLPDATTFVYDDPVHDFRFSLNRHGSTVFLTLSGELDAYQYNVVSQKIAEEFRDREAKNLVVNMSRLMYLDSKGLTIFVSTMHILREREGAVYLVGCQPFVRRAFAVTRLDRIMHFFDTLNDIPPGNVQRSGFPPPRVLGPNRDDAPDDDQ